MFSKIYFACLSFILSFFIMACETKSDLSALHTQDFIYMQGLCCQNFQSIDNVDLPDDCKPDYDLFFAINLDEFNIADDYNFGDTLSISWDFTSECEAQGDQYDCIVTCDMRHGVPIKITSVD